MHYTIRHLIDQDANLLGYYDEANKIWNELDQIQPDQLRAAVSNAQTRFERLCGGRSLGQEIMAVVGIARFYETRDGFGDRLERARRVYELLKTSYLSLEVKYHADDVAKSYALLEEQ